MTPSRILIIEDDPNTLSGLEELLRLEGHAVRGVSDGQTAFDVIRAEPMDVILCDYRLPDADGLHLCCQLKGLQPQLALFIMTAFGSPELADTAHNCGILRVFSKPIDLDELFKTLASVTANRKPNKGDGEDLRVIQSETIKKESSVRGRTLAEQALKGWDSLFLTDLNILHLLSKVN